MHHGDKEKKLSHVALVSSEQMNLPITKRWQMVSHAVAKHKYTITSYQSYIGSDSRITVTQLPWNSHLMLHLNTSAMSCAVQPTASRPAHIAPALLPAIRFTFTRIPASDSAYKMSQMHTHSQTKIMFLFLFAVYTFKFFSHCVLLTVNNKLINDDDNVSTPRSPTWHLSNPPKISNKISP